ncbi:MAG: Na+/H+ antiporter subunit E [Clostridia bacterium]|nr:Na+/H+ antiporter subunit E [Clostridia bacterium]
MYCLLFAFWLVLNGKLTLEVILLGLALTAALGVLLFALFSYTPRREWKLLKKIPLFVCYLLVLLWEIIKANVTMFAFILNERKTIEPTLVTFQTDLKTKLGRFILANSITLTPGTITVRMEGDKLTVHCLRRSMLDTSTNSTFVRWIKRLEK